MVREHVQDHLKTVVRFARPVVECGDRVLFLSLGGKNRSVALAIAFLMKSEGYNLMDATEEVMFARRERVLSNQTFVEQLALYAMKRGACGCGCF